MTSIESRITRGERLALIPARGGSKGIPGKNVRMVGGKPLIAYSIEQALQSDEITRVIVSTDDAQIADVSRDWGAEVPFMRPEEFARDDSPDLDVFRHALEWLRDQEGYVPELVVHLRPPNPIREIPVIDQAIRTLDAHPEADSLRSVWLPLQTPYKMWRIVDGYLEPIITVHGVPESYNEPRQALPEVYRQNGYIDITRPRTVLGMGMMNGRKVLPFVVEDDGVDLDYEEDLQKLEEYLANPGKFRQQGMRHPI